MTEKVKEATGIGAERWLKILLRKPKMVLGSHMKIISWTLKKEDLLIPTMIQVPYLFLSMIGIT